MVKKIYKASKPFIPLSRADVERVNEKLEIGVLDIDYARWVESQLFYWRLEALDLKKRLDKKNNGICCSLCFKSVMELQKLIQGAAAFICDRCVIGCLLDFKKQSASKKKTKSPFFCGFCKNTEAKRLIAGKGAAICDECCDLCLEILVDDSLARRQSKDASR